MAYIGKEPLTSFVSLKRQDITGDGTASYTLDHKVASVNDILVYVNHVKQDPSSMTVSGTSLTMGGTVSSSDDFYIIFLGQALQTVTPADNTITTAMLQDNAVTDAKFSGTKGITQADQWRVTGSVSSDGTVTSLERVDTDYDKIGTGMTESSGIFTFPATGIYLILVQARFVVGSDDNQCNLHTEVTTDNSSYNRRASATASNNSTNELRHSAFSQFMFDVTNTTTHKIKFVVGSIGSGNYLDGATDANYSSFTFLRLGDT